MLLYATIYGSFFKNKKYTHKHPRWRGKSELDIQPSLATIVALHQRLQQKEGFEFLELEGNIYHQSPPSSEGNAHRDKFSLIWNKKSTTLKQQLNRELKSIQNTKKKIKQKKIQRMLRPSACDGKVKRTRTYINLLQLFWKNKKMLQKQRVKLFAKTKNSRICLDPMQYYYRTTRKKRT